MRFKRSWVFANHNNTRRTGQKVLVPSNDSERIWLGTFYDNCGIENCATWKYMCSARLFGLLSLCFDNQLDERPFSIWITCLYTYLVIEVPCLIFCEGGGRRRPSQRRGRQRRNQLDQDQRLWKVGKDFRKVFIMGKDEEDSIETGVFVMNFWYFDILINI